MVSLCWLVISAQLSRGELVEPCLVFPVFMVAVLTVRAKVLSETCAEAVVCSIPPRPGDMAPQDQHHSRRYAVASALAASAVPSLVLARGHRVEHIPELPLVITNDVENLVKTAKAVELFKGLGAYEDIQKVKDSRNIRRGVGKTRNRRYVQRRGPLVIYKEDNGIVKALRNIPGVETCAVTRLNLLQLAPGGHLGRFCIWTQGAFDELDTLYGTQAKPSSSKAGYHLPRPSMRQADLARLINSDEIQSVVRPKLTPARVGRKKNGLKNLGVRDRLNPYYKAALRNQLKHRKVVKAVLSKEQKAKLRKQKNAQRQALLA